MATKKMLLFAWGYNLEIVMNETWGEGGGGGEGVYWGRIFTGGGEDEQIFGWPPSSSCSRENPGLAFY